MILFFLTLLLFNHLLGSSEAISIEDKIQNIWGQTDETETSTSGACSCKEYNECMGANTNGEGLFDIRIDECGHLKKCCNDDKPEVTTTTPDDLKPLGDPDPTIADCRCVDYYLCPNGTVNKNGDGIIDIRISDCGSYLEKCCVENGIMPTVAPSPPPPPSKGCGFRNANGVGFKIKDPSNKEAEFGEFPWMIAVFTRLSIDDSVGLPVYQCGGALIHPSVVVSAAHCVIDKENLKVRAGEWDTQTKKEQYMFQDRNVDSVVIHPEFKSGPLYNDIALLTLEMPIKMAPHINVICLPPPKAVFNKGRCFSSGWGKNNFAKEDRYQVILKKIDLPIVPRARCEENLRKTRLGKFFELHESFVCAGGESGKDTCTGDGGSPLVCPIEGEDERYFHVGIVAWGIGCGDDMVPGVYVNVALFRQWIDEEMEKQQFDINVYQI